MQRYKCSKKPVTALSGMQLKSLGYSMLAGKPALSVTDRATGKMPQLKLNQEYDLKATIGCTQENSPTQHIDILCESADVVFDSGKVRPVDTLVVTSFFTGGTNYTIAEFELYASDELQNLFTPENMIAHERGIDFWEDGQRNNADWLYSFEGEIRYLGIRVLKANATDDIIRLGHVGMYHKDYTMQREYAMKRLPNSLIAGMEPQSVTDGVLFDDTDLLSVKAGESLTWNLSQKKEVDHLWVITKGKATFSANSGLILAETQTLKMDRVQYLLKAAERRVTDKITLTFSADAEVDAVVAYAAHHVLSVNPEKVLCNDFLSIGANVLPMSFMPESIKTGYNEVYWELERARIMKARPTVVRMWFQPDWLVETYEQYKTGAYNFNAPKMYSVYKYLDIFKECGTEVEFDFGWKVTSTAQSWFSFECGNPSASAPRELDLFAKCCGKTMHELIKNRGYDNIKYLTFYNEPDYALESQDSGDFIVAGTDRIVYWERMLRMCREALVNEGVDSLKMWCCEQSGCEEIKIKWINYMNEHCSDIVDMHTVHRYMYNHKHAVPGFEAMKAAAGEKPITLTECGQCYDYSQYTWEMNHVQLFMDMVNSGFSGAFIWVLNSMPITDPCSFTMRNPIDFWDCPQMEDGLQNVREVYYEWAMLSRYVPAHSKSITTDILSGIDDMRAAAFQCGEDDYTVVVEMDKRSIDRELDIHFPKALNKKFYKHVYKRPCNRNGLAMLPRTETILEVNDTLHDTVCGDYCEIVYTTLPPVAQIELPFAELSLKPDSCFMLSAGIVDGEGDIRWEIGKTIGDGFEIEEIESIIHATEKAKPGDMCALKAISINDPEAYAVMIVKVI